MKRLLYIISLAVILVGCTQSQSETTDITPTDEYVLRVMQALLDTSTSVLDIKDDFIRLTDTLLYHAQYHADEDIRIGAKSYALVISALCMDQQANLSSEKIQFFLDSMVLRLSHIQSVWYYNAPDDSTDYRILTQNVIKMEEDDDRNHITTLDVYFRPQGNLVIITYPFDAIDFPMIRFAQNPMAEFDTTCVFNQSNAIAFEPRDEGGDMTIVFDQSLIDAMLSHQVMYLGYLDDNESKAPADRIKSCMMLLSDFHNQYPHLVE